MHRIIVVAACVMGVLVSDRATGQSPAGGAARFEVASVKPIDPFADLRKGGASGGPIAMPFTGVRAEPGGRLVAVATLRTLLLRAYGVKDYQLEGGPEWLPSDYFSVTAKAEHETATEAEMNEMLKSLLAERFGLRVHVETRSLSVHTLTVARPDGRLGSGLKRTSPECEATLEEQKRTGTRPAPPRMPPIPPSPQTAPPPLTPTCGLTSTRIAATGAATYAMGGWPLSSLVEHLSSELEAPVVDETGLVGRFDAVVEYESGRWRRRGPDLNSTDPLPVPLPQAVQQQLGLKLDKGTAPLAVTIVDAAERPSPN
jgi:uncharacterized protein (TIGR03435 family)